MTLALRQTGALAWRSVRGTLRTPQALFPSLIFPLILMAIFTGSFGTAPGTIPGFPPVRGFLDFALAGAIVQGILIGGTSAGAAFALDIEGGVVGVLILLVLAALMAVAVSGLGIYLALRTGSAEAVQGTFPLFFALLFFSSAFFPRETMTGWFKAVADVNPISYLVEAMRDLVIEGIEPRPTLIGLGVVLGLAVAAVVASYMAFRRRLAASS